MPNTWPAKRCARPGVDPLKITPEQVEKALPEARKITEDEHEKVIALGGLHITGTERHEARRIDNQLRGRAGRQGDPGSSRFFLSLEDDLMRIFGSDRLSGLMARIGMGEGVPIEHSMVSKAIERAQKQVEGPELLHPQAPPRIRRRHEQAADDDLHAAPGDPRGQGHEELRPRPGRAAPRLAHGHPHPQGQGAPRTGTLEAFRKALGAQFGIDLDDLGIKWDDASRCDEIAETRPRPPERDLRGQGEARSAPRRMREFERIILLQVIDTQWKDHLLGMDYLKEGIGLRGYGQRDPLVEYKKESFDMFQAMLDRVEEDTVRYLFLIQPQPQVERAGRDPPCPERRERPLSYGSPQQRRPRRAKVRQAAVDDPGPTEAQMTRRPHAR